MTGFDLPLKTSLEKFRALAVTFCSAAVGWLLRSTEQLGRGFDSLLFPMACGVCGQDDQNALFWATCRSELFGAKREVCRRCAQPMGPYVVQDRGCPKCRKAKYAFDAAIALARYEGPMRELSLKLKKSNNAWLAHWLAQELFEMQQHRFIEEGLTAALGKPRCKVIVAPIPLHWKKRWKRGYNQAGGLSRSLACRLGASHAEVLKRVTPTASLAHKKRNERLEIMKEAFEVRHGSLALVEGRDRRARRRRPHNWGDDELGGQKTEAGWRQACGGKRGVPGLIDRGRTQEEPIQRGVDGFNSLENRHAWQPTRSFSGGVDCGTAPSQPSLARGRSGGDTHSG